MSRFDRIRSKPDVMCGESCIKGTRIPVSSILGAGHSRERILAGFPDLTPEDIDAALWYSKLDRPTHHAVD